MICRRSVAGGSNRNDDAAIMRKVADNAGKEPGTGDVIRDVGSKPGTGDCDVIIIHKLCAWRLARDCIRSLRA